MHRLGCQFIRRRYVPKKGNLRHDLSLNCWARSIPLPRPSRYSKVEPFSLNQLPTEVLHNIIKNLDAYSLKSLRKTSLRLHDIVDDFIDDHGMVEPVWKRIRKGLFHVDSYAWTSFFVSLIVAIEEVPFCRLLFDRPSTVFCRSKRNGHFWHKICIRASYKASPVLSLRSPSSVLWNGKFRTSDGDFRITCIILTGSWVTTRQLDNTWQLAHI